MTPELKKAAQDALNVQNACNLSGILNSWAKLQSTLKDSSNGDDYLRHAVNIAFLSKVVSLMVVNADCLGGVERIEDEGRVDLASRAFNECERIVKEAC
jgi:hypothetical protein